MESVQQDEQGGLSLALRDGKEGAFIPETLGGRVLPAHIAVSDDEIIYVLNRATHRISILNPCTCQFEILQTVGGTGTGDRAFSKPQSIELHQGRLYICDPGFHRVSIFGIPGLNLYSPLTLPSTIETVHPWEPSDITFDTQGHAYVVDPPNKMVHRFNLGGVWKGSLDVGISATHISMGRDGFLYLTEPESEAPIVVDTDGEGINEVSEDGFVCPGNKVSYSVEQDGTVVFICTRSSDAGSSDSAFGITSDGAINQLESASLTSDVERAFAREGEFVSIPLDSKIESCQWHRLVVNGSIPIGTRIRFTTYTSDVELPEFHISALPDSAWDAVPTTNPEEQAEFDALILSQPGRFLWLRIQFRGNGKATPRIANLKVEFPRISLCRYLPAIFGAEPVSAAFTDRFLSLFDTTFRGIERQIDYQARLFDPLSAPSDKEGGSKGDFLSWLGTWIGITLDRQWPEAKRRRILKEASKLFPLRGTPRGLVEQLLLILDVPTKEGCNRGVHLCERERLPLVLEHFKLRKWLYLGSQRLGSQARLWGERIVNRSQLDKTAQTEVTQLIGTQDPLRDPFHKYAHTFSVFLPAAKVRDDGARRAIENVIEREKPAHTQANLVLVEPRFRIGIQSMIGYDTVVGCYPTEHQLGEARLDNTARVTSAAEQMGDRAMKIGVQSRVGSTTLLD